MAVICPFKNTLCCDCKFSGWDTDRQRAACYLGKTEDEISEARAALRRREDEIRQYHKEEASIGDL